MLLYTFPPSFSTVFAIFFIFDTNIIYITFFVIFALIFAIVSVMIETSKDKEVFMQEFFKWTAWEMTPPQSYGLFHILFVVIGGIVAVLLAWFLRKANDKQNKIILGVAGGFLILTELYKQLFYFYVVKDCEYSWWIFPFQLCSIPMYLCILCLFIKNEKVLNYIYNFMFAFNFFGGAISFAEPSGLNHSYWTLTLHAYTWHMILVFIGLYLFFSKRAGQNWYDFFKGVVVFLICCCVAQIFNVAFRDKGGVNMFYISPYVNSSIFFFDNFNRQYGWFANMCLYLTAIILGAGIMYYAFWGVREIFEKKRRKTDEAIDMILKIVKTNL